MFKKTQLIFGEIEMLLKKRNVGKKMKCWRIEMFKKKEMLEKQKYF